MADAALPPRFYVPPEGDGALAPASAGALPPVASAGALAPVAAADASPIVAGDDIALCPGEAHHAAHVLRLKAGDAVEVFDGVGGTGLARVVRVKRSDVLLTVETALPPVPRPVPAIHLAFAVPKGSRMDWLLEKATELGAASLEPVVFRRSVAAAGEPGEARRRRWFGHIVAAAKQARLDWLPALADPVALDALLARRPAGVYGDTGASAVPPARALSSAPPQDHTYVVVGPEGGLTDGERAALDGAGLAAVRLGRTILRVETAAVALLAAVTAAGEE
jgi:16S rRNA (uracil1498-N3)-methyltransferase